MRHRVQDSDFGIEMEGFLFTLDSIIFKRDERRFSLDG